MIIQFILIVMAIVNLAPGITTFFGSRGKHRMAAFWFLIATICIAIWSITMAEFIGLSPADTDVAPAVITRLYVSAIILIIGLAGYNSWGNKIGRVLTVVAVIAGTVFICCIITRPDLLYTGITLSDTGNSVQINVSPFYFAYSAFIFLTSSVGMSIIMLDILAKKKRGRRVKGDLIFMAGFSVTMTVTFLTDVIIPMWDYSLIWIGPIATATGGVAFFYRALRQHLTTINTHWMVGFAYTIIATMTSIIYIVIFYLVFISLFKGQEPSGQVIILNFIMFLIIMLSMPAFRELLSSLTSMITVNKINLPFITRKLSQYASKPDDYQGIATLLTDHLHFTYVGFLINGKIYNPSTAAIELKRPEISTIAAIPLGPTIWQRPDEEAQAILNQHDIVSVASLGSKHQILIGKPLSKKPFSKKDLVEIETILNLVAAIL